MRWNTGNKPHGSQQGCMTRKILYYECRCVNNKAPMPHAVMWVFKKSPSRVLPEQQLNKTFVPGAPTKFLFPPFLNKVLLKYRKTSLGKPKSASVITHLRFTLAFSHLSAQLFYCLPLSTDCTGNVDPPQH